MGRQIDPKYANQRRAILLATALTEKNYTELGELIGVSGSTIKNWARGIHQISPTLVTKLCALTNNTFTPHDLRPDFFPKNYRA